MDDELAKIREWAQGKLDALQEPPWATRRPQQLIALIDEMLASRSAAVVARIPRHNHNIVHIDSARRFATNRSRQRL